MMRPFLPAAIAAALACCVASTIAASPRYAITSLRPIATAVGMYANVNDLNDNGLAVGNETRIVSVNGIPTVDRARTLALRWSLDGTTAALTKPANAVGTSASRVNFGGLVAGRTFASSTSNDGVFVGPNNYTFSSFGAVPTSLDGLNDAGAAIGGRSGGGAFVLANGSAATLDVGSATFVALGGINDNGLIVGHDAAPFASKVAAAYSSSSAPSPLTGVTYQTGANAVNRANVVAGFAHPNNSTDPEAATFAGGQVRRLGVLPRAGATRLGSFATDLNDRGDVVGTSGNPLGSSAEQQAFLYRDGQLLDLATLIDGDTLPAGFQARGINNRGQIVGNAFIDHDNDATTPRQGVALRLDPIRVDGDANVDGVVNYADLAKIAPYYGASGNGSVFFETGDFNYDWGVDIADLYLLAANYGTPQTLNADLASLNLPQVPEPTAAAVLALATLAIARRRRIG